MAPPFAKQLLVGCLPLHVAQFLLLIDDDVMGVTGFWAATRIVSTPFALSAAIRACSRSTRSVIVFTVSEVELRRVSRFSRIFVNQCRKCVSQRP
ncbi:hypothetical protein B0H10DRAFT_2019796, partial [Mycena sp. CBHHK59/15]